jgi:hypothetical protein
LRWLCFWRPPCLRRRAIVNFTHDATEAFEGILWAYSWGGWLTLKDVSALKASLPATKLPGDIILHRSQIAYLQVAP